MVKLTNNPKFECPRHGYQSNMIGVTVDFDNSASDLPKSLEKFGGKRRYCMTCWLEWIDANCEPLRELTGEPHEQE